MTKATAHWTEGEILAGERRLHLHRTGGDKPAVILLHGITDNGLCWSRTAHALEDEYDLIMLDARGHGLSSRADSYLPEAHVADLLAVIKSLELERPALLGHSMGAHNAALFAATHPERVGCLLLEDPPWPATPQSIQRDEAAWRQRLQEGRSKSMEAIMAAGRLEQPAWDEEVFPAWAEAKRQVDPAVVSWLDGGRSFSGWRELLPKFSCPTLLLTGDTDVRVVPEVAQEAQQLCPSLEVVNIHNAGHSIRRDQFGAYLVAVRDFLGRYS